MCLQKDSCREPLTANTCMASIGTYAGSSSLRCIPTTQRLQATTAAPVHNHLLVSCGQGLKCPSTDYHGSSHSGWQLPNHLTRSHVLQPEPFVNPVNSHRLLAVSSSSLSIHTPNDMYEYSQRSRPVSAHPAAQPANPPRRLISETPSRLGRALFACANVKLTRPSQRSPLATHPSPARPIY